ncbi:MAG TPA: hypothetical protein VLM85_03390 [Polyangiaceae bacterium]|nr:hypothetical protein [Polyangiaceae bacterium]
MNLLKPGTTLLHKYQIERLRLEGRDAILYEAADPIHGRQVCIEVLRREPADAEALARFQLEARGSNVLDVGTIEGMHFVVVNEGPRKTPSRPPPLPVRARKSKPPPLPVPIPIYVEEAAAEAPSPPISQPETVFEQTASRPARRSAAWLWAALLAAAAMTGAGAWYTGHGTSGAAPAAIVPPLPSSEASPEPAPPPTEEKTIVVDPVPAQTDAIPAPTAPPQPPPPAADSASSDPLTI